MKPRLSQVRGAWRLARVVCTVVLLPACASLPQTADQPGNWPQTVQRLQSLQHWRLSARLAVQTVNQGGSLDLYWAQQGEDYRIRLIAPLGQGAAVLQGNADSVTARLAGGERFQGRPETLMQQHFGVAVPVTSLVYWLRGLPAPDTPPRQLGWNGQQRLHHLVQNGWRIEMQDYKPVAGRLLPHRFYLEPLASAQQADGGDTSVRLVIRQWLAAGPDKPQ